MALVLAACTSAQIRIIDKHTKAPINGAYVYIQPMQTLPFAIGPLNILLKSDSNGVVVVPTSSFYVYVLKDGYSLGLSERYDEKLDMHTVELEKGSKVDRIILNLTTDGFLKVKATPVWREFLACCSKNNIKILLRPN